MGYTALLVSLVACGTSSCELNTSRRRTLCRRMIRPTMTQVADVPSEGSTDATDTSDGGDADTGDDTTSSSDTDSPTDTDTDTDTETETETETDDGTGQEDSGTDTDEHGKSTRLASRVPRTTFAKTTIASTLPIAGIWSRTEAIACSIDGEFDHDNDTYKIDVAAGCERQWTSRLSMQRATSSCRYSDGGSDRSAEHRVRCQVYTPDANETVFVSVSHTYRWVTATAFSRRSVHKGLVGFPWPIEDDWLRASWPTSIRPTPVTPR